MNKLKHDTSSVFIFNTSNKDNIKLLLVEHKKFDKWMIPGGHVESYENPYEGALREVKEETGLEVELINLHRTGMKTFNDAIEVALPARIVEEVIPPYKDQPEHYHIDFLYIAKTENFELSIAENESKDIAWFNLEEVQKLNLFESTKEYAIEFFDLIQKYVS